MLTVRLKKSLFSSIVKNEPLKALFFGYAQVYGERILQRRVFWKDGLRFSCARCSGCCRFDPGFVYLSERDLVSLQQWASLERDAFIKSFCRWVLQGDGYEYLCLKERANYDCILWNKGCIAYQNRPFQCSSYPFWACLLETPFGWEMNARSCPGINNGTWHSPQEIQSLLDKAQQFPVIKRKNDKTGSDR